MTSSFLMPGEVVELDPAQSQTSLGTGESLSKQNSMTAKDESRRLIVQKRLQLHGVRERRFFDSADQLVRISSREEIDVPERARSSKGLDGGAYSLLSPNNNLANFESHHRTLSSRNSSTGGSVYLDGMNSVLGRHSSECGHVDELGVRCASISRLPSRPTSNEVTPTEYPASTPLHDAESLRHTKGEASPLSCSVRSVRDD